MILTLVNLLDNKKLNDKVYFYTNEYVQNNFNILDIAGEYDKVKKY